MFGTRLHDDYGRPAYSTSTELAPWFVVSADDKENAGLIVSAIMLDTFEALKMAYPKTTTQRRRELKAIRKKLAH
jgi:hypothetical protein